MPRESLRLGLFDALSTRCHSSWPTGRLECIGIKGYRATIHGGSSQASSHACAVWEEEHAGPPHT
eukprot:5465246-Pleurochrysis_carterae.AAC.1